MPKVTKSTKYEQCNIEEIDYNQVQVISDLEECSSSDQESLIRLLSLSVYILDKTGTAENKVKSL